MSFHRIILRHEEIAIKQWAAWLGVATNTVSTHWKNLGGSPSFDAVVLAFGKFPAVVQDELLALFPRHVEPAEEMGLAILEAQAQLCLCARADRDFRLASGVADRLDFLGQICTAAFPAKRSIESVIEAVGRKTISVQTVAGRGLR